MPNPTLDDRARDALRRAERFLRSLATEGGYLWWYSADLKERAGENRATPTQIWVQPPGTPSVGTAFLRAYEATGEPFYLQAAREAARALAAGQLQSGGWDYLIDFDPRESRRWYRRGDLGRVPDAEAARRRNVTTFDDDTTQSALRFLLAFADAARGREDASIRSALEYGLNKMREAQYPNGAWPQRWDGAPHDPAKYPIRPARMPRRYPREHARERYHDHYTLNDDTQRDCIRTMLDAHRRLRRPEYLRSARKGGDFLVLAQLPAPQAAWAQQYNADMEPAWARAFEPPALCSRESAGAIRTLAELYAQTRDAKYLRPIPAALDWLRRSQIAPNQWARFYELHTNKPIYGDIDGRIHYTLEELTEERRRGYAWRGTFGVAAARAAYEQVRNKSAKAGPDDLGTLEAEARRVIAALDERGRWIVEGRVQTRVFAANVNTLCAYLERVLKGSGGKKGTP